jgi:hypothetical protein
MMGTKWFNLGVKSVDNHLLSNFLSSSDTDTTQEKTATLDYTESFLNIHK